MVFDDRSFEIEGLVVVNVRTIDLRSDTVTRPTPEMRRVIAEAEVGDDMFGEDPTINRLEQRVAEMLGKDAAVYACSGIQSNQMALRAHCSSGDEILLDGSSHIFYYEQGAPAALHGVTCRLIDGEGGIFGADQLEGMIHGHDQHESITKVVCVENTTNRGGGRPWPLQVFREVADWAHARHLAVHVDGARLFNACQAVGYSPREFCEFADTVSICFSKGLGCPMGSMLVGSQPVMARARRARKLFGGGIRQGGMMAASALFALDHHVERLKDDHAHARWLAEQIANVPQLSIDLKAVSTNIVIIEIAKEWGPADRFVELLQREGVLVLAFGRQKIRLCTHLDIPGDCLLRVVDAFQTVAASSCD